MSWRPVLDSPENVVDGKAASFKWDDGLLVATSLFEGKIASKDFWVFLLDDDIGAPDKKGLDVCASAGDTIGFFFPRTFIVPRKGGRPA